MSQIVKDLIPYFEPLDVVKPAFSPLALSHQFGQKIRQNQDSKTTKLNDSINLVLMGAPNDPVANHIRRHLYAMGPVSGLEQVMDLGNFRPGKNIQDTISGWKDVLFELGKQQMGLVLIGGSTEVLDYQIEAFSKLEHPINLSVISPDLHVTADAGDPLSTYLNRVLLNPENRLFEYTHLGYQSYFTDPDAIELLEKLHFNHIRLGELRKDIREMEPYLRNSDMLAFSMAAIRASDSPGNRLFSPNGLYAEEACQLARYAGLSDKLMSFTLNDIPLKGQHVATTHNLAAQLIWFFVQGFTQRQADYPFAPLKGYQKFIVNVPGIGHDINFYKSPKSDRWWLEVPYPNPNYPRSVIVACTLRDYQLASQGEIPERWLRTYKRIC